MTVVLVAALPSPARGPRLRRPPLAGVPLACHGQPPKPRRPEVETEAREEQRAALSSPKPPRGAGLRCRSCRASLASSHHALSTRRQPYTGPAGRAVTHGPGQALLPWPLLSEGGHWGRGNRGPGEGNQAGGCGGTRAASSLHRGLRGSRNRRRQGWTATFTFSPGSSAYYATSLHSLIHSFILQAISRGRRGTHLGRSPLRDPRPVRGRDPPKSPGRQHQVRTGAGPGLPACALPRVKRVEGPGALGPAVGSPEAAGTAGTGGRARVTEPRDEPGTPHVPPGSAPQPSAGMPSA